MKPLIEKLTLSENTSFVARTYRTPNFEVPWHQHNEYELILILEGLGTAFVGDYIGDFSAGDIFFLAPNLPHTFQKAGDVITSAVVIQFPDDFWGNTLINLPEGVAVKNLLLAARQGLKIPDSYREKMASIIRELENQQRFARYISLFQCLHIMAESGDYLSLSSREPETGGPVIQEEIDLILRYTNSNFQNKISLREAAAVVNMSVAAFCKYFRRSTKKTYIDYLNEIRIGYACKLLKDTSKSVIEICFESGFHTLANFNKQFLKYKSITPSSFRRMVKHTSVQFAMDCDNRVLSEKVS
ncbi:AraC family transcriptional regulator [Chitinophaga qingshengii]|uniref:AraC family transcriptional regulator n=1 Tax=Chitinophaga qingshengii TaxID=1569794 RepID=A0ABR7TTB1_9BACT|nr:AraC family transcriptional regulator [Chitinophaga qingshengii]MBC9932696.1 AraC family transcriptional regulator [Chitinophaga qingshengii]